MKKISCIIPVYNVEEFIIECLDSVYNQDYTNKELIIVDDGSTDNSSSLIKRWMKDKDNVIFCSKTNGGLSDARNHGLEKATGEYIAFIDSDDVLLDRNLYSQAVSIIESNPECDIVQFNMILKWNREDANLTKYKYGAYESIEQKVEAYSDMTIHDSCCDKLFRSKVFKDLRFTKGVISEDLYLIPELIANSNTIIVADIGNYGYRFRPGSITTSKLSCEKAKSALYSYCRYWKFLEQFEFCHKNFYTTYVNSVWQRVAVLSSSFSLEELGGFYDSSIFIRKTFFEWIKEIPNINGLKSIIKSYIVFVCGPKYIDRLKRR